MVRRLLLGFGLLVAVASISLALAMALGFQPFSSLETIIAETREPIVVGLIHSQTGPLAISEKSLIDAEVMAIEEINARGGVAGRLVKPVIADGRSDPGTFADQARRLIEQEKAVVLIGGLTAECRKTMISIVEERSNLLIFPGTFEGIERSSHVIYAGGSANQVVMPAVWWCFEGLKAKKFFVVGTEEVSSRCLAELAKDAIKASMGETLGEIYLPMAVADASPAIQAILAAKPDVVLNFLVGDSNLAFYAAMRRASLTAEKLPVVGFNIAEDELRRFPRGDVTGHYSAWSYFQSLDRPENHEFIRKFKARYPEGERVIGDPMVAAYNGLMLWAQAADEVDSSDPKLVLNLPKLVLDLLNRQSLDAPEGIITIDPETRIAWRPFYLGKARADGQFDVVWSIPKPTHPVTYVGTRSKAQWNAFLDELKARWGGRWSSSEPIHPSPTPPVR